MRALLFGAYGISYEYYGSRVLDDVSLEMGKGELVALLGPNGSGKTTLMKLMSGILPRQGHGYAGSILWRNTNFFSFSVSERARRVVYVAPDLRMEFPMTCMDLVLLGRTSQGSTLLRRITREDSDCVQHAMERCRCWGLRNRLFHTLSGGEKQLVLLARALAQGARVLLLDESLSKMDLDHQAAIGNMLRGLARQEGCSILLVSHDLNLASEWADICVFLKRGVQVASGPTREVITIETVRSLYPGANLVMGSNPATGAPKIFFAENTGSDELE